MKSGYEVPAGQTVMFSSGCYSDYSVGCIGKLLKPLNEAAWNEMCAFANGPSEWRPNGGYFETDKAMTWLREHGYIEDMEYVELHLGDYGDAPKWEDA